MLAIIFEVDLNQGHQQEYLDIAASLLPELEKIDGFISIERFSSIKQPGKILSLSFWRDEQAIQQWRAVESHRLAQQKGRDSVFAHYRLRVAEVCRDYGMEQRQQAPQDSVNFHSK